MIDTTPKFIAAPNPTLSAEHWHEQYPPIETKSEWLINKFTGEIFPNTPQLAERSDILEPYFGEIPKAEQGEIIERINSALAEKSNEEMAEL